MPEVPPVPEQIDVRNKTEIFLLQHCVDCNEDYVAHLHIRSRCGCCTEKPSVTFWQKVWKTICS